MDLKHLKTFVHVAELGSLSKAAARLRIAQPALSRQIRLLEQELNTQLFVRHGRGMVLTPSGSILGERARAILHDLEAARAEVAADTGRVEGRVAFGAPPTVGDALSARVIQRYHALYPDVSVRIVSAFSGYLLDWLQRGDIDLAIVYEPEARQNLRMEPLFKEDLYLVGGPDHRLASRRQCAWSTVVRQRLVIPGPQHGLRMLVERAARKIDRTLDIAVEADSLQTMKDLVENNMACTILPLASVHREVREGRLQAARIVQPNLMRTLVVAEALDRKSSRAARLLRETLYTEVRSMVDRKIWAGSMLTDGDATSGRSISYTNSA